MTKSATPLIVIAGSTASGKSALAMAVAKKYDGELICADSRTVYRGMDIGTAKPTAQDQKEVKHHLLDVINPGEPFSAADFKKRATEAIDDIAKRGKLPIMVGGTGLYIDAVIFDYQFGEPAEPAQRRFLQELTIEELQQLCLDNSIPLPENSRNKRHLIRAIELGGLKQDAKRLRPNTIVVALTTNREDLRSKIAARAQEMVSQGVLDEVARLGEEYGWDNEALTGNIYRILRPVAEGVERLEPALERFITSDMQLAKRQITWLRRNPFVVWGTAPQLQVVIEHFIQQNKLDQSMPAPHLSATIAKTK